MTIILTVFTLTLLLLLLLDNLLGVVRRVVDPSWRIYAIFQAAVVAAAMVSLDDLLGPTPPQLVHGGFIVVETLALIWAGWLARRQAKQEAGGSATGGENQ